MDVQRLMKRDDRATYEQVIKAPLLKTAFVTLSSNGRFPDAVAIDPTAGELVVNRYGKNPDEVDNVVEAVLAAN